MDIHLRAAINVIRDIIIDNVKIHKQEMTFQKQKKNTKTKLKRTCVRHNRIDASVTVSVLVLSLLTVFLIVMHHCSMTSRNTEPRCLW
jgi:hypothetical protein